PHAPAPADAPTRAPATSALIHQRARPRATLRLPHPAVDREPTDPELLRRCAHAMRRRMLDRLRLLRWRVTARCRSRCSTADDLRRYCLCLCWRDLGLGALPLRRLLPLLARPSAHAALRHAVGLRRFTHPQPRRVCDRRYLFFCRVPAPLASCHPTPAIPQSGSGPSGISPRGMDGQTVVKRTYVIHGCTGDPSAFQPGAVGQLTGAIQYTKSRGDMWIGTMVDVGAYWLGQRAFSQAMTSQTGDARTWSWTL